MHIVQINLPSRVRFERQCVYDRPQLQVCGVSVGGGLVSGPKYDDVAPVAAAVPVGPVGRSRRVKVGVIGVEWGLYRV